MTNIAEIKQVMQSDREKQVMQSDREKVNSMCIYELELNTSRTNSRTSFIYEIEPNICRAETRAKNCGMTSNRNSKNTYETASAEALDLGSTSSPAMSLMRLSTPGKKSSSGK